jgi:PPM family protein phosphatase
MRWPWSSIRRTIADIQPAPDAPSAPAPPPLVRPPVDTALLSDVGCKRELNEDSGRIVHAGGDRGLLVVVADGMGGHQAGEVASQTAVETVGNVYSQAAGTPGEALDEAFRQAHERIFQAAQLNDDFNGMGTTCTALAIAGADAWVAHVGDSRLYLLRGGEFYQLSEDHTQCMDLVRRGVLTLEQAHRHEDRHVLIQAMGTRRELHPSLWTRPMKVMPGDVFLLCSDGLHDLVADAEMSAAVQAAPPHPACRALVNLARARGGFDNITVAVVSVTDTASAPARPGETRQFEVSG